MHIHNVVDTDKHYIIDGVTRTITNINETKRELVQHDHNSERFTFEIPRFVDSHDFTECNEVQVHYVNVDKYEKVKSSGIYTVDDLGVMADDEETVMLSWLISGNATEAVGTLNFSIRFVCVTDGRVDYAWNTTEFKGITILPSINNTDEIIEQNEDVLLGLTSSVQKLEDDDAQIRTEMVRGFDEVAKNITEVGNKVDSSDETARGAEQSASQAMTMAQEAVSMASRLPDVTADDNGKVLTVVDGVWSVVALPVYDGAVRDEADGALVDADGKVITDKDGNIFTITEG